LAAEQLDKLWTASMDGLSESYEKVMQQLETGAAAEAHKEFRAGFRLTVKKLYSEAATVYPPQFAKMDCWCLWMKTLYTTSAKIETALAATPEKGSAAWTDARDKIEALRAHFWSLHSKTQRLGANDCIYAFRREANAKEPNAASLKEALQALDGAPLSHKAKAQQAEYGKAFREWKTAVEPSLTDGASLGPEELKRLRESSEAFYRLYGIQFE
jgi:hypothetical protein